MNLLRETSLSRKPPTRFQTKPVASKSEPGRESRVWSILPGRFWGPALLGVIKITAPCYRVLAVLGSILCSICFKATQQPCEEGMEGYKEGNKI